MAAAKQTDEFPRATVEVEVFNPKGVAEKRDLEFRSLRYMPLAIVLNNRGNLDGQLIDGVLWACTGIEKSMETIGLLPTSRLFELYNEMQAASAVDLGESDGSPKTSSKTAGTARRSKRTSSTEDSD